jgi:hypothetical protein
MRYRVGDSPGELGAPVTDDGMLVGTALFGLVTGALFVYMGLRGRQIWLSAWGTGLVLASITYLVANVLGFS